MVIGHIMNERLVLIIFERFVPGQFHGNSEN